MASLLSGEKSTCKILSVFPRHFLFNILTRSRMLASNLIYPPPPQGMMVSSVTHSLTLSSFSQASWLGGPPAVGCFKLVNATDRAAQASFQEVHYALQSFPISITCDSILGAGFTCHISSAGDRSSITDQTFPFQNDDGDDFHSASLADS